MAVDVARAGLVAVFALGLTSFASQAVNALVPHAHAKSRFAIEPPEVESSRAYRYASLDSEACLARLDARGFPYELLGPHKQVDTPLRFSGPIRGVTFKPTPRAEENEVATSTIADCRLALAVDDLAQVLAKHGVVEAGYLSMYRPGRVGFIPPGRRHPSALAIDLSTITLEDGTTYSVLYDFHGRVGSKTCGDGAAKPTKDTSGAQLWRDIVCEMAGMQSFNLLLTPHYDWGHRDHFHMEVRTQIRWYLIQ
jgi:hypothetical protein